MIDYFIDLEIGAIVGSLLGALVLAGITWGLAKYFQRKAAAEGIPG